MIFYIFKKLRKTPKFEFSTIYSGITPTDFMKEDENMRG